MKIILLTKRMADLSNMIIRNSQILKYIVMLFITITFVYSAKGNAATSINEDSISFINRVLNIYHFDSFFQDCKGRIWGITWHNGLMMWNGMNFEERTPSLKGQELHACIETDSVTYLIGGDRGLYQFNLPKQEILPIDIENGYGVMALEHLGGRNILVLTRQGLLNYNYGNGTFLILQKWERFNALSLIRFDVDRYLILTKEEGIFIYDAKRNELKDFEIHGDLSQHEIMTCMAVFNRKLIIGTITGLYVCDLDTRVAKKQPQFNGITVKTITRSGDRFFICTNDGLFVRSEEGAFDIYRHSANAPNSILNNRIWNCFEDRFGNIWVATDRGISVIKKHWNVIKSHWHESFNHENSNRTTAILCDQKGRLWIGSMNGLSCSDPSTGEITSYQKKGVHHIPDNLINNIQEGTDGTIWIFTENGLSWLDEKSGSFISPSLIDPANGTKAIYTYGMTEDTNNNLWVATWSNGVLKIDKQKLIDARDGHIEAQRIFSSHSITNPMPFDGVTAVKSVGNRIWCASDKLYSWSQSDLSVDSMSIQVLSYPWVKKIFSDKQGRTWFVNISEIVASIEKQNSAFDLKDYIKEHGEIAECCFGNDRIWILSKLGLGAFDINTETISHLLDFPEGLFTAVAFDESSDCLWLGGLDGYIEFAASKLLKAPFSYIPSISSITINDKNIDFPLNDEGIRDPAFIDKIILSPDQYKIGVYFYYPTFPDTPEVSTCAFYRLKGVIDEWKPINGYNPYVNYQHLNPGKYDLQLGVKDSGKVKIVKNLEIIVEGPWYGSWWFNSIIILVALIIIGAVFMYYRTKRQLKLSEIERVNSCSVSQKKTEFMTDMSMELKNPLTLLSDTLRKVSELTRTKQIKDELDKSKEYVRQINNIIKQILEVHTSESLANEIIPFSENEKELSKVQSPFSHSAVSEDKFNVILIEDNHQLADFIIQNITFINWFKIYSNDDAFENILQIRPALIICELRTNNIDGAKLCKKLKTNILTRKIPLFFLSSQEDVALQLSAYQMGAERFITKPFDIKLFSASLFSFLTNLGFRHKKEIVQDNSQFPINLPPSQSGEDERFVSNINAIIDRCIDDPSLNITRISKEMGLSEKIIYRRLKALLATTGVEYIRQRRLDRASELLKIPQYNINEVMYMVGFSSPSYFSKCFSSKFGMTPSEFREDHK